MLGLAHRTGVTVSALTPTQWLHLFQQQREHEHGGAALPGWHSLRIAVAGGEPFPPTLVNEFFSTRGPPRVRVLNAYGTTETTICHMLYECVLPSPLPRQHSTM